MTVEQFDPQSTSKANANIAKQTTTLETPVKIIEEQSNVQASNQQPSKAAKVGFVSLGCLN